jgi:LPS export ABC transporter protein LptC
MQPANMASHRPEGRMSYAQPCAFFRPLMALALAALFVAAAEAFADPGDAAGAARRRPRKPDAAGQQEPAKPQLVTPRFRYTHISREGQKLFSIIAQKGEMYDNSDMVLTGVEEIRFFGQNGRVSRLAADFGRWQNAEGDFEVWGNVRGLIETDGGKLGDQMRFQTEKLVYKDAWKAVVTMRPVRLETASITTTGVGLNYNVQTQETVINSKVVTTVRLDEPQSPGPVVIRAGRLQLEPGTQQALYSEHPSLELGRSRLEGQTMHFFMAEGQERLEVDGSVVGTFHLEQPASAPAPAQAPEAEPPVRVVSERALFHRESRTATFLRKVEATRAGELLKAERLVLLLTESGHELQSALAEHDVEVLRADGRATGGRLAYHYPTDEGVLSREPRVVTPSGELSAEIIHFRKDGSLIGERRVRAVLPDGVLTARTLTLHPDGSIDGERKVVMRHTPRSAGGVSSGGGSLLDLGEGQPVDIAAERLRYTRQPGRVLFEQDVRVLREGSWLECARLTLETSASGEYRTLLAEEGVRMMTQERFVSGDRLHYDLQSRQAVLDGQPATARTGEDIVTARQMTFSGTGREYSARQDVRIQMLAQSTPGARHPEPQPVQVSCGRAHFGASGTRVELAEKVELHKADENLKLRSEELDLYLLKDRRISNMEARGSVFIEQADRKAQGEVARYLAQARRIEIEGNPAKLEQPGSTASPQRAVLHLDTQRIEMDGETSGDGRMRAVIRVQP